MDWSTKEKKSREGEEEEVGSGMGGDSKQRVWHVGETILRGLLWEEEAQEGEENMKDPEIILRVQEM